MTDHNGGVFYIPKSIATTPAEGHCFINRWWVVHPEHGVAFYCPRRYLSQWDEPSPQCNDSEATLRILIERLHPGCVAEQIPAVYIGAAIVEMHKQRAKTEPLARTCSPLDLIP